MNLNMDEWKEFYLKNLYDIQMGNGLIKINLMKIIQRLILFLV